MTEEIELDPRGVEAAARAMVTDECHRHGKDLAETLEYTDRCWKRHVPEATIPIRAYLAHKGTASDEARCPYCNQHWEDGHHPQCDSFRDMARETRPVEPVEAKPVAWLHETDEPDGRTLQLLTLSAKNPWLHWLQSHRDMCVYRCTPLYASPPSLDVAVRALERLSKASWAFLRYFDPSDLPEDKSQQWQSVEHQIKLALEALALLQASPVEELRP